MTHLEILRARLALSHGGRRHRIAFGAVPLPTGPAPEKVIPDAPSIRQPDELRAALAQLFYTLAYHKGQWSGPAQKAYQAIASLPFYYFGPSGFYSQPGWSYLIERALAATIGVSADLRAGYQVVLDRWQAQLNAEWAAAGYFDRVDIGQIWQSKGYDRVIDAVTHLPESAAKKAGETATTLKNALPDIPIPDAGDLGFGLVVGAAVIGLGALVALRPDVVADVGGRASRRWAKVVA